MLVGRAEAPAQRRLKGIPRWQVAPSRVRTLLAVPQLAGVPLEVGVAERGPFLARHAVKGECCLSAAQPLGDADAASPAREGGELAPSPSS